MAHFGLAVVPPAWEVEMPLEFTAAEKAQYEAVIEPGTRVIIYMTEPVNGVVAEGEVHGAWVHVADWPATTSGAIKRLFPDAAYLLPLRVLYHRSGEQNIIRLARVRELLRDPDFPQSGGIYRPLEEDAYTELRGGWT